MADRLRVLSLIKGLAPGGAEQLLLSSARVRDHEAFEEEVAYLLEGEPTLLPNLQRLGVPTYQLVGRHAQDPRWIADLRRLLDARHFDVVHVHSPYVAGLARLVVRSLSRRSRPRVVSTEHNMWSGHARATRALNTVTFPLGDAWLAVSRQVRATIPRHLRERVEVVLQGVVLRDVEEILERRSEIRAEVRTELGLQTDDVVIVTVANYRAQKAYPDLFDAACQLRTEGVRARLLAIGQGPLESEISGLHASLGLRGYLDLLGYRPDAIRVAAGCDIFVLASHFEGLPVAIMEALAVGLPVVATCVGGVPEAVRDGVEGLIVPPHRPDLLAGALSRLIGDRELRSVMGGAARRRGRDYDIVAATRRTEDIYRDICSRS